MDTESVIIMSSPGSRFDARYIFLILFLSIALSLAYPKPLSIAVEPAVRKAYEKINSIQPGNRILIAFDYGPSTMQEIHPGALAIIRHCFRQGARPVFFTMWNEGIPMIEDAIAKVCIPLRKKENVDYVNLGFKWGGLQAAGVIEGMGSNLRQVFPVTAGGTPYEEVPLLQNVENFNGFHLLISLSAGSPGVEEYIQYANARYHIPMVADVTKIMAPKEYAFLASGQLSGLCSGIAGAAEYEELIRHPGGGIANLFAQSVAHIVVIAFILFGNLLYFLERKSVS